MPKSGRRRPPIEKSYFKDPPKCAVSESEYVLRLFIFSKLSPLPHFGLIFGPKLCGSISRFKQKTTIFLFFYFLVLRPNNISAKFQKLLSVPTISNIDLNLGQKKFCFWPFRPNFSKILKFKILYRRKNSTFGGVSEITFFDWRPPSMTFWTF